MHRLVSYSEIILQGRFTLLTYSRLRSGRFVTYQLITRLRRKQVGVVRATDFSVFYVTSQKYVSKLKLQKPYVGRKSVRSLVAACDSESDRREYTKYYPIKSVLLYS